MLVKLLNDSDTSADAYVYAYTNTPRPSIIRVESVYLLVLNKTSSSEDSCPMCVVIVQEHDGLLSFPICMNTNEYA